MVKITIGEWIRFIPLWKRRIALEDKAMKKWMKTAKTGESIDVEDAVKRFLSSQELKNYDVAKRYVDYIQSKRKLVEVI